MSRSNVLKEPITDVKIEDDMKVGEFIEALDRAYGFMAGHLSSACKIVSEMIVDKEATKFLSFTGNLIATGLRGIIAQMIREGFVDVIVTTCGAIDHDIVRSIGSTYYKGSFDVDDTYLASMKIHRLGNIFIPWEDYGERVEEFTRKLVEKLSSKVEWGVREILYEAGRLINDENSILKAAYDMKVPIYVPGIVDGAFGTQLFIQSQFRKFRIDPFIDMKELSDLIFKAKKIGAIIVGGGISKHHVIWWSQFKEGLDYVIYITTAIEYDGSLSGARPKEAISWGKVKPKAKKTFIYGDATLILPLIVAGVKYYVKRFRSSRLNTKALKRIM